MQECLILRILEKARMFDERGPGRSAAGTDWRQATAPTCGCAQPSGANLDPITYGLHPEPWHRRDVLQRVTCLSHAALVQPCCRALYPGFWAPQVTRAELVSSKWCQALAITEAYNL